MAATQYSPLFGDSYAAVDGRAPFRNRAKGIVLKPGARKLRELFDTVLGATAGAAASATHKQVAEDTQLQNGPGGGARTIETVTDISRNSDAADVTALKEIMVNVSHRPASYVVDLSGNGGPAFT